MAHVGMCKPLVQPQSADVKDACKDGPNDTDDEVSRCHPIVFRPSDVVENTEREYENDEAVRGVDFDKSEVEKVVGEEGEGGQFSEVEQGKPTVDVAGHQGFRILDHGAFEQGNGDHADQPPWEFPCEAECVKQAVTNDSAVGRGRCHEPKVVPEKFE